MRIERDRGSLCITEVGLLAASAVPHWKQSNNITSLLDQAQANLESFEADFYMLNYEYQTWNRPTPTRDDSSLDGVALLYEWGESTKIQAVSSTNAAGELRGCLKDVAS